MNNYQKIITRQHNRWKEILQLMKHLGEIQENSKIFLKFLGFLGFSKIVLFFKDILGFLGGVGALYKKKCIRKRGSNGLTPTKISTKSQGSISKISKIEHFC